MTCVTQTWWQRRMWIQSSVWISDIMLRQNKMRIGCYVIVVEIFTKLQILLQKEIIFKSGFLPAKAFHDCHSNKSGGGIYAARLEQQGKMSFKKCTARRSGGAASITDVIHTDLLKGRKTTKLRTSKQLLVVVSNSWGGFGSEIWKWCGPKNLQSFEWEDDIPRTKISSENSLYHRRGYVCFPGAIIPGKVHLMAVSSASDTGQSRGPGLGWRHTSRFLTWKYPQEIPRFFSPNPIIFKSVFWQSNCQMEMWYWLQKDRVGPVGLV